MPTLRGALLLLAAVSLAAQSPFEFAPAAISDSLTFRAPLAGFAAPDLTGKIWTLADLRGSLTIVNIWATWYRPCREELPKIQALYEESSGNREIQVLTFSLNEDPAITRAFLKSSGYTFPVIVNPELWQKLFPSDGGIPNFWVIDPQGRRSEPFRAWTSGRIVIETEKLANAH